MTNRRRMYGKRLLCALSVMTFAALLLPLHVNAQVSVSQVRVTVSGSAKTVSWCDTNTSCNLPIWTLPGGSDGFRFLFLQPGETGVLTQTGFAVDSGGHAIGSNFDTSDRASASAPTTAECFSPTSTCSVKVELNTGTGLMPVYQAVNDPLDNLNIDTGAANHVEAHAYITAVLSSLYTLGTGYADNDHATAPFPNPFDGTNGTTKATFFIGQGLTNEPPLPCSSNCYDAGALVIQGQTAPTPNFITVTQGGWGAPPHGNNPGAFLVANFGALTTSDRTIGCTGNSITFTSAAQIQAFLPQTGKPGVLPNAGVFAGQVLALSLNVGFSNAGLLPGGLGSLVLTSGPLAGMSVGQVLALANQVLGGCTTLPAFGLSSVSDLNNIIDAINQSFDTGI